MFNFVFKSVLAAFLIGATANAAQAEDARLGARSTGAITSSAFAVTGSEPLTIGAFTPTFGAVTLGVSRENPLMGRPLTGYTPLSSPDVSTTYKTEFYGAQVGIFSGYSNGGSMFSSTAPTAGWNFGASLGYAGFYVQAGISDGAARGLAEANKQQGWLAGFGYQAGGFNLRLTYMAAQSSAIEREGGDTRTWIVGGIYQLSARVRLNADAFTGTHDFRPANAVSTSNAAAPQGTGARVGVQLQF